MLARMISVGGPIGFGTGSTNSGGIAPDVKVTV